MGIHSIFKSCNNIPQALTGREIHIARKQAFCDSIAGLNSNDTYSRTSNPKQCRQSTILNIIVAIFNRVTATYFSTLIGCLRDVVCLSMCMCSSRHRMSYLVRDTCKYSFHHISPYLPACTSSHQFHHTELTGAASS